MIKIQIYCIIIKIVKHQVNPADLDAGIDSVVGNLAHSIETNVISMHIQDNLFNVSFQDLLFRDARYSHLKYWLIIFSRDWALYNRGIIYFENAANCIIASPSFHQFDGDWIALYGYNRDNTFIQNDFGSIDNIAIRLFGKTKDYTHDDTIAEQPRFINIIDNYVDDICPILLNDAFGGNTNVIRNLLVNNVSCNFTLQIMVDEFLRVKTSCRLIHRSSKLAVIITRNHCFILIRIQSMILCVVEQVAYLVVLDMIILVPQVVVFVLAGCHCCCVTKANTSSDNITIVDLKKT